MTWFAILAGSLACYALKALGYVIPQRVLERPMVTQLVGMFPIALLAALLAVVTLADGMQLQVDARLAGLAAAAVALTLRAPFIVVVAVGAASAAVLRALG